MGREANLLLETVHDNDTSNDTAIPAKGHGAETGLDKANESAMRLRCGVALEELMTYTAGEDKDTPVVDLRGISQHGVVLDDLAKKGRHGCGVVRLVWARLPTVS